MHFAPVRPPRVGAPLSTTAVRLKSLPPPMLTESTPLPSYPDPERAPAASSPVVYAVYEGDRPGELVLRALAPDEAPPPGVMVARLKRVLVGSLPKLRPAPRRY